MRVVIVENHGKMGKRAAEIVRNRLMRKPDLVLGLGTGSTSVGNV